MDAPQRIQPGRGTASGMNAPFGRVERQIALRYLGAKKSEGGVAIIAAISFICIMLAITAMITIMSIMNGFRENVIELLIGSEGHVFVSMMTPQPEGTDIDLLEQRLAALPGVERAFEFSEAMVGVQANDQLTVGRVIGISPEQLNAFELVAGNVQYGSLANYGQGVGAEHEIAMGVMLAERMGLTAGDRVRILTSRTRSSAFGTPTPISKIYTVGAVFQTGLSSTDEAYIYMDLKQSQLLFSDGKRGGNIQIRLHDADDIDKIIPEITKASDKPLGVMTWKDRNSSVATALRSEQVAMRMIFIIVVIIATFPILAAMIMLVKNKSKDIAILRTIGATRNAVLRIFFIAGTTIGFLGTLAGLILGVLICLNIDVIQAIIEGITGVELFPADIYMISTGIPAKLVWSEVIGVAMCGFLISACATFFPALGAAKTDPVEALRYD